MFCLFNEVLVKEDTVHIPLHDGGFLYGDGIYASLLVQNGIPLFFEHHTSSLQAICHQQKILFPKISKEMILELLKSNHITSRSAPYFLRINVTGGPESPSKILQERKGFSLITVKKLNFSYPSQLNITFCPFTTSTQHAQYKSLANLNRYYIRTFARQSGYDDAISLSSNNEILELSFGNLFWIQGRNAFVPSPKLPLYHGMTIQVIIEILKNLDYDIHFVKWQKNHPFEDHLWFGTSTFMGVTPIYSLEKVPLPINRELTTLLQKKFQETICNYQKEFSKSLSLQYC